MMTRRPRRNLIRPENVRLRAKFPVQETNVFRYFLEQRRQGIYIVFCFGYISSLKFISYICRANRFKSKYNSYHANGVESYWSH